MHGPRNASLAAAALIALVVPLAAGCSSSPATTTTTTTQPTASTGGSTTTTVPALPATGSVDGVTLAVISSPATGTIGHTTIHVTAVLTGTVKGATLGFQVSDQPSAETGRPATSQHVVVQGPGTFRMPVGFKPRPRGPGRSPSPTRRHASASK